MLGKMQRRFILVAAAAFGLVMLLLVAGINIVNYIQVTSSQDEIADRLMQYELHAPILAEKDFPPIDSIPGAGPEAAHTTRFFAVHCKDNGEMMILSKDFISTVDDQTAREYAQEILQKGKQRGYYQEFRYLVSKGEGEDVILFLNVLHPLQSMRLLLAVSSVIGVVSFLVVLALVILFSKRAIRPYAQNIARQKQFITNASHELKTPITSIATSVDILAMEYEENEWIVSIQKQIQKMTRLVGDLVALSRLDEDMPFPEREQFSLSEAAWEIAEPFAALAEAKKKEYSQEIAEDVSLYGNRDAIQKLISILLENAVKYSPENGKISLRVFKKKNKAVVEVYNTCHLENTGELNRIFERFYRLEESHSAATGGTGIGLSMAQAIVEAHGGKIEAVSPDGESLKIVVVL